MEWRISRAFAERLLDEAAASPDAEVCGLLLGGNGEIIDVRQCRNVADDPAGQFEIDPEALIAAHKAARMGAPGIAGCYHSHPNGEPAPSALDRAAGFAGLWLIVAGGELHGWRGDSHGRFEPARLSVA